MAWRMSRRTIRFSSSVRHLPKNEYVQHVCREVQQLKIRFGGHDEVVLHEHDLRNPRPLPDLLQREIRERFHAELTTA